MLLAAGLVLLALGLLSGAWLVLVPLGLAAGTAGLTLWILFPAFSVVGFLMAAAPSNDASLPLLARVSGVLLMLLALLSALGLVAHGAGMVAAPGDTFSLWYVLVVGLALGAAGLATHGRRPGAAPAARLDGERRPSAPG